MKAIFGRNEDYCFVTAEYLQIISYLPVKKVGLASLCGVCVCDGATTWLSSGGSDTGVYTKETSQKLVLSATLLAAVEILHNNNCEMKNEKCQARGW